MRDQTRFAVVCIPPGERAVLCPRPLVTVAVPEDLTALGVARALEQTARKLRLEARKVLRPVADEGTVSR